MVPAQLGNDRGSYSKKDDRLTEVNHQLKSRAGADLPVRPNYFRAHLCHVTRLVGTRLV